MADSGYYMHSDVILIKKILNQGLIIRISSFHGFMFNSSVGLNEIEVNSLIAASFLQQDR